MPLSRRSSASDPVGDGRGLPRPSVSVFLAVLVGASSAPLIFLLSRLATPAPAADAGSVVRALIFAVLGASVSLAVGSAAGLIAGTLDFAGRSAATVILAAPLAAPPAFWWIGFSRLPGFSFGAGSLALGSVVAGVALSPIPFLLTLAATREIPANVYEAARLSLPAARRIGRILIPLCRSSLACGFLLVTILLLGESEIPFLFGFRTTMTDIVTVFSRGFEVASVARPAVILLAVVLVVGGLATGPLRRAILAQSRGGAGVVRRRIKAAGLLGVAAAVLVGPCLAGYLSALLGGPRPGTSGSPVSFAVVLSSIVEPVVCAWAALALGVAAAYSVRRSKVAHLILLAGFLLFCMPAGVLALSWIGLGQNTGGWVAPIWLVHSLRLWGLAALGFAAAYARLPESLEKSAELVAVSGLRRALTFTVPVLAHSLAATAFLIAALVFADRDVTSLLLAPGSERLMLDLYLLSANAPAFRVALAAFAALGAAVIAGSLAALGPWLLLRLHG